MTPDNQSFLLVILAIAAILFYLISFQLLILLRITVNYLHHIAADQRQQIIELQVITAGLSGLAGAIESYLEQTYNMPAAVQPPDAG